MVYNESGDKMDRVKIKEAAKKTNDTVGDGTTTTIVLTYELYRKGLELIKSGVNNITLAHEIERYKKEILKRKVAAAEPLSYIFTKVNQIVKGWINYFRIGSMKTFITEFGKWLRHISQMMVQRLNKQMKCLAVSHQKQINWNKQNSCFGNWQKHQMRYRAMKFLIWLMIREFQRGHWRMQRRSLALEQRKSIIRGIGNWIG